MQNLNNINDNELLSYLLTSEFDDNELTSDMLRFLLLKFKYFYRIQYSRNQLLKSDLDLKTKNTNEEIDFLKKQLSESIKEKDFFKNEFEYLEKSLLSRKLTFKERWKGRLF
jgi:hypothetical protein